MAGLIQAVDRALKVLEALAEAGTPQTLSEISVRVGLHASTVHRLLATLRARGFVEQSAGGGRYRVGVVAFRIGHSLLEEIGLGPRLRPVLTDLAARTGETANLVVRHGAEAVYIDHALGTQVAKLLTRIGQRVPLHCTAVGKVLLAAAMDERDDVVAHLDLLRFTPGTITSRKALLRELDDVRTAGFAVDREEHELGVGCVAAPVCDATGSVVAALGISGPAGRVLVRVATVSKEVRVSATAASRVLGCPGDGLPPEATATLRHPRTRGGDHAQADRPRPSGLARAQGDGWRK